MFSMDSETKSQLAKLENNRTDLQQPQPLAIDMTVIEYGSSGETEIIPRVHGAFGQTNNFPTRVQLLPCGLPPSEDSNLRNELEKLLLSPQDLPIFELDKLQQFWPRKSDPSSLYHVNLKPNQMTIKVTRDMTTGRLQEYEEVSIENGDLTSRNSTSLKRSPIPERDRGPVTGQSTNMPFWPGGFDPITSLPHGVQELDELNFDTCDLLSNPPNFGPGMKFDQMNSSENQVELSESSEINISDILAADVPWIKDEKLKENTNDNLDNENRSKQTATDAVSKKKSAGEEEIDSLVVNLKVVKDKPKATSERWFFRVNINQDVDKFHSIVPNMAFTWPFELDAFQKQAIMKLEKHENVFVAAHTSAGKTVVAEYAIALASKHVTKAIYTSPIKALSNQKFRDFKMTFGDVGLLTGDVQINPEASCLIMTTEILRSMLYNGSDTIRDIEWVIFDEVHYINDDERGVVWEEVLILLPDHVGLILLSATVSNSDELADWVGRTKRKQIHVISTTKRPVPLEHFLYRSPNQKTDKDLIKIFDSKEIVLNDNLREAFKRPTSTKPTPKGGKPTTKVKDKTEAQIYQSLIKNLIKKDPPMVPAVVFVFSRKKCDNLAGSLSTANLTTKDEKSKIKRFIKKSISILSDKDQKLPQVVWLCEMLQLGVAVHHSGILPVLKEIVEMVYQEGLVKCLFATETFAMGVNMPAKCVIFDTISKHDGNSRRRLHPGEYIQMAGRAGRRGKDKTGTVIILLKEEINEIDLRQMITGKPQKLQSKFRLTYGMALKVLRVEDLEVEDLMWRSFAELHKQVRKSTLEKQLLPLQTKSRSENFSCPNCISSIDLYCEVLHDYYHANECLQKILLTEAQSKIKGRFVVINNDNHHNALGIVLDTKVDSKRRSFYKTFILINESEEKSTLLKPKGSRPYSNQLFIPYGTCQYKVEDIGESDIAAISKNSSKVKVDKIMVELTGSNFKKSIDSEEHISAAMLELKRVSENNSDGLQTVLSFSDIKRFDAEFRDIKAVYDDAIARMKSSKCVKCPHFAEHLVQARDRFVSRQRLERVKFELSKENLVLQADYKNRRELLQCLGYIDERGVMQLKGRVACEINNCELLITELVFDNILNPMAPEEIAALLSCIVFQQKNYSPPELTKGLLNGVEVIRGKAKELDKLEAEYNIDIYEKYEDKINFGLVEVVHDWAKGEPFAKIMTLTDVSEGVIVRCIQRLDSACMEVKTAARIIGDPVLFDKMIEASRMIKRDICFTASLYIK